MIGWIISITTFAVLAWMVYNTVQGYRTTEGPFWERLRVGARDSAVILWSYVLWAAGWLISHAADAAMVVNIPEVSALINKLPAAWLGYAMIGIAAINIIARLRSL